MVDTFLQWVSEKVSHGLLKRNQKHLNINFVDLGYFIGGASRESFRGSI